MRVIFWREKYGSSFLPWQVNLACALVISVHLVVYCYVFCATLYFRLVTAAATKLRNYISTYTFHKNTSLHLMCILMPPLVKEIMETAALHNESPNYRRESNVKRVVGAAHQVVSCVYIMVCVCVCVHLFLCLYVCLFVCIFVKRCKYRSSNSSCQLAFSLSSNYQYKCLWSRN
jgi:hypothetical protein